MFKRKPRYADNKGIESDENEKMRMTNNQDKVGNRKSRKTGRVDTNRNILEGYTKMEGSSSESEKV